MHAHGRWCSIKLQIYDWCSVVWTPEWHPGEVKAQGCLRWWEGTPNDFYRQTQADWRHSPANRPLSKPVFVWVLRQGRCALVMQYVLGLLRGNNREQIQRKPEMLQLSQYCSLLLAVQWYWNLLKRQDSFSVSGSTNWHMLVFLLFTLFKSSFPVC